MSLPGMFGLSGIIGTSAAAPAARVKRRRGKDEPRALRAVQPLSSRVWGLGKTKMSILLLEKILEEPNAASALSGNCSLPVPASFWELVMLLFTSRQKLHPEII